MESSDDLGRTALATNTSGRVHSSEQYYAYGKPNRLGAGTNLPTDNTYTGQKSDATGLMYYGARFYDPSIGTFISADTIVPDKRNVFDYNRFMYVRGRVMNMTDPTGHYAASEVAKHFGLTEFDYDKIMKLLNGNGAWLQVLLTAHDGDQITAWNSVLQSEAGGTFQLNAETGQIEVMSNGVAIPSAAVAGYAVRKPGDMSALPDGFGLHNMGPYKLRNPKGEDPLRYTYNGVSRPNPCDTWDCVALGLDSASLGLSVGGDAAIGCAVASAGAAAGICVPAAGVAKTADAAVTLASVSYTSYLYANKQASDVDLAMNLNTAYFSTQPGLGIISGVVQTVYDLVDPFLGGVFPNRQ